MRLDPDLVAGVAAGGATSVLLNPFDVVKTRLQVDTGRLPGRLRDAVAATWRAEGVAGFYRGTVPALLGSGTSWGLYFYFYEACKRRLLRDAAATSAAAAAHDVATSAAPARLSTMQHMYAAWEAGSVTCLFTNPLWLIKTRMQLQTKAAAAASNAAAASAAAAVPTAPHVSVALLPSRPYRGLFDAFASIVREEGPRGLYRGLVPALLLTSHGMVQFGVYEDLKARFPPPSEPGSGGSSATYFFAFGAVSKVAAVIVTYPYQVIKARLQQRATHAGGEPPYAGLLDCVRQTLRREGLVGFYKGFVANMARVAPQSAVTMVLYEAVRGVLVEAPR